VSRSDRGPDVAVDFAPARQPSHVRLVAALVVVVLLVGGVTVAVTQLLLR
jgi:hypothetical protein